MIKIGFFSVFLLILTQNASAQYSYQEIFPEYNLLNSLVTDSPNEMSGFGGKLLNPLRKNVGFAFLGSAVLPGLTQAANDKWLRASLYAATEIAVIVFQQSYYASGKSNEKKYRSFINSNWSVQKYAEFIVSYHNEFDPSNPITINDLANSGVMITPGQYNYGTGDWGKIDLIKLRDLESKTPYDKNGFGNSTSTKFSHPIPNYGSQQYYELVAKYFQFSPGWADFASTPMSVEWSRNGLSPMFINASDQSTSFNDQLRFASRLTSLILLNHVVSAFDGYFTVKLKNYHLENSKDNRIVTGVGVTIPF